jgi:cysteine/glycine-rich protein
LADKDKEIYCNSCYGKKFGPKGYGYAGGAAFLTSGNKSDSNEDKSGDSGITCGKCGKGGMSGKFCSSCGETLSAPSSSNTSSNTSSSSSSVTKVKSAYSGGQSKVVMTVGGSDKCAKCGKSVYANERATGAGKVFHESCFRCTTCGKGLSSSTLADKDGIIYCNTCYAKNFGPKGYGFGGGSASTMAYTK